MRLYCDGDMKRQIDFRLQCLLRYGEKVSIITLSPVEAALFCRDLGLGPGLGKLPSTYQGAKIVIDETAVG